MDDSKVIFYEWPNGMKSVAGGTRTRIALSRPWQREIQLRKEGCPFCDPNDPARIRYYPEAGGWWLRRNLFTPYPFHQMAVPARCLEVDDLRNLGYEDSIDAALKIAMDAINENGVPSVYLNVHIGVLAGQNIPHLHWHIVQYDIRDGQSSVCRQLLDWYFDREAQDGLSWKLRRPDLVLHQNALCTAVVGGVRAGQCFILSSLHPAVAGTAGAELLFSEYEERCFLADAIHAIVSLYNKKFLSVEGLAPEFNLTLNFGKYGAFQYGLYTPILNHWGSAEQMALYEGCHITLPWPHELTAEYLKAP